MIRIIVIDTPYAIEDFSRSISDEFTGYYSPFFMIDLPQTQMEIQRRFRHGPYCKFYRKPADQR